jgi:hypothetical protein
MLAIGFLLTNCYHLEYGSEASPAPPSAAPGPNTLIVELDQNYLGACAGGWVTIVYDPWGYPIPSRPGEALRIETSAAWQGFAMIGAQCGTRFYAWSPNLQSQLASGGGVARMSLGTTDLTRCGALICADPWTPGIFRPSVPFGTQNYFRCPLRR